MYNSTATQTELLNICNEYIKDKISTAPTVVEKATKLLPTIAQRKCLGIKKPEESAKESLYSWEVENFAMIEVASAKEIRARREQRHLFGQKVQKISKLLSTIKDVSFVFCPHYLIAVAWVQTAPAK